MFSITEPVLTSLSFREIRGLKPVKMFWVVSLCLRLWHLVGAFGGKVESVSEVVGNSVTLNSDLTELMDGDEIQWRFGNQNTLIAEINKQTDSTTVYDDVLDGRFRDRLKLDNQTGSLTIMNITTQHAGRYKIQTNKINKSFKITVIGEESLSVKKGDSVTLSSGRTELTDDDVIQWKFLTENSLIAEINKQTGITTVYDDVLDGRFRDRLKLDDQTGSLTITDMRITDFGGYRLYSNIMEITFFLGVHSEISAMEGESVTLNNDLTEVRSGGVILWRFKSENALLAKISNPNAILAVCNDDVFDERFRDRLKPDNQTGSLTIMNITMNHAGDYEQWANELNAIFSLTVFTRLPVPVISSNSSNCSSSFSSSSCSLLCWAVNVGHVTLSWYKGNSLLSSISVSDLSISLSLPLEVEYQDKNIYSCVINNPIRNQTTHLNISRLCHTCSGSEHCCGFTEAVIRLVLSALVGVATVTILVYDIRSRRNQRDQIHVHTADTTCVQQSLSERRPASGSFEADCL
ncbi:uncharacterized protein LOC122327346 isoform X2 [Puntigrus tetrazona]|uniref:uncharacterized protein LOC122327346 isoform X2 n=1 Tax=Puntigrus tetrazona TaxID=1606681 RepID=UPI001C8A3B71|nr:uncharacterized protein LOC122327346 isoform X2 [Puntigrus tetrazona]